MRLLFSFVDVLYFLRLTAFFNIAGVACTYSVIDNFFVILKLHAACNSARRLLDITRVM